MSVKHYEVIVVGGGISGAALFFELAKYSDINNIVLSIKLILSIFSATALKFIGFLTPTETNNIA